VTLTCTPFFALHAISQMLKILENRETPRS
jgi:hypothetical protein